MEKPLVSIIITNYNYDRFLRQAIDSALSQTYPYVEAIVVDDGSTDRSRDMIQSYGDKVISILKTNGGQASAFNAGFAASQGEIICFLDSDDIFTLEKAAAIVDIFSSDCEIDWCYHPLQLLDDRNNLFAKSEYQGTSKKYDLRTSLKRGKLRGRLPHCPATSGLCFRRSLLEKILPMPEATDVSISDNYIKFTALALSQGFLTSQELAIQRIHSNNAFTYRKDKQELTAKINILTAYWMRKKFPAINKFANNLFAIGIGTYWRMGRIEAAIQENIRNYLSSLLFWERLEVNFRALYHCLKQ